MSKRIFFGSVDEYFTAAYGEIIQESTDEYRTKYAQARERLLSLEQLLKPTVGELVLVIHRKVETDGCSMGRPAPLMYARVKETLYFGRLTEPGLRLSIEEWKNEELLLNSRNVVSISTAQHVMAWYGFGGWSTRRQEGDIREHPIYPTALTYGEKLDVQGPFMDPKLKLEVIAGNKAVNEWTEREDKGLLVRQLLGELEEDISLPAIEEKVAKQREYLAKQIEPLWHNLMRLRRRVDAVSTAGREGFSVISLDGISLTVCENDDDAFWISWGDRERAKETLERLTRTLTELKELGPLADDLYDVHLIRHVIEKLAFDWE